MKYRDLAELGVKLLGLYCVIQFLNSLPVAFMIHQALGEWELFDADFPDEQGIGFVAKLSLGVTSSTVLYLLCGVVLLLASSWIAGWLVRSDDKITGSVDVTSFTRFMLQLVGIYALITWLPLFAQGLVRSVVYGTWADPRIPVLRRFYDNWSTLTAPALGSLLGFLMLFRISGMVRLVRLARPMSKRSEPSDDE